MRKWFTVIFLTLVLVRCNYNEEQNAPSKDAGMKKPPMVHSLPQAKEKPSNLIPANPAIHPVNHPEKKKRTKKPGTIIEQTAPSLKRTVDTTLIRKLMELACAGLEIDLREPVNREYLFSPVENPEFSSMIQLSHERAIRINFDNDIFDNTDRYYTNGIRFDFISPFLKQFPLSWLMVPYWGNGINYYGLSITQNMYTPYTTKVGGIHNGDRPYAACLFVGSSKISNDLSHTFRQTSEIDLGVIGPSSYGDFVQKSFHTSVPTNNEPLGWEYQIQNDLVLNYNLGYEKGIVSMRNLELNLNANGALGTLYTNMSGGFQFRTGLFYPYFSPPLFSRRTINKAKGESNFQAYFFVTSIAKLVGYDATLEGGMLNRSSVYTLEPDEISRFVYQGSAGLTLSYAGFRLDIEQFLLSPEFHTGSWHKWVHIGVTFGM
ncbi:MAG: lipid A deacylase LpxR family protein [Bacteroidetes bacterium]|nr:lipid A deacylase LpxR family protein [Bacteroidota bacterium]